MTMVQNLSALLLAFSPSAFGASLAETADFVCGTIFSEGNYSYTERFSARFATAVPETQFRTLISQVRADAGKCQSSELKSLTESNGRLLLHTEREAVVVAEFQLDAAGRIDGFRIPWSFGIDLRLPSLESARAFLEPLPGRAGLTVFRDGSESWSFRSAEVHPTASAFKLYVLGAVADAVNSGRFRWSDTFPIRDEWRSLPSGEMHDPQRWPVGTQVTLADFANKMISISDNTATDHLIALVGRENVEAQFTALGNSVPERNRPLLTTAEMFRLKFNRDPDLTPRYLRSSEAERRTMLGNAVAAIPFSSLDLTLLEKPRFIEEVEWFATPQDLCRAMMGLARKNQPEVFRALSLNTLGLPQGTSSPWPLVGYKGGGEPGVVSASLLLKNREDGWDCVAGMWHNTAERVDELRFLEFVRKAALRTRNWDF